MGEEEKMFQIGLWSLILVAVLMAALQVCYRTQNRALDSTRKQIVELQQKTAVAQANFASYVRPEILRNLVVSISPDAEAISFHKTVSIDELPTKMPTVQE